MESKLVVTMDRKITSKILYFELEKKGRDKNLYRLAKVREYKDCDLEKVKCI